MDGGRFWVGSTVKLDLPFSKGQRKSDLSGKGGHRGLKTENSFLKNKASSQRGPGITQHLSGAP